MSYNSKTGTRTSYRRLFAALIVTLILSMLMSFAFLFAALDDVHADAVGSLNGREYDSFDDLCDALDDFSDSSVTIEMLRNWDYNESHDFDQRLIIPKNCRATLNMNGNVFDRELSKGNDWEYNGELICIRSGSTLTINGGDDTREHYEPVYSSNDADNKASTWELFHGGVLTGGCSTGGAGGIHISGSNVTLTLNGVTIAGCRAECPWYDSAGTNSGYGGAIWITGEKTTVNLNDSTITGNHAQLDGGGIYASNKNEVKVLLDNSHVDENYSRSDGGGINLDGEKLEIRGSNDSTVSGNVTNGYGGGIYLWNDEVTVSGLTIEGNSAKQGGGIYTLEETIDLAYLVVKDNAASDKGSGIYIANDGNTISNCKITENQNMGVYVEDDVDEDFKINGSTVIKDNDGGNLKIQDDSTKVSFSPSREMNIHIGYVQDKDIYQISPYLSADVRKYLTPDDTSYIVTYDYEDGQKGRANYLVKEDKYKTLAPATDEPVEQKPDPVTLSKREARPEIIDRVEAGGEKTPDGEYALIRGISHHERTNSGSEDRDNVFYYSDGFFYGDPYEYNDHLATASWTLAFAGTYLRVGGSQAESYKYKHTGIRQFYADIGCPDQQIYVNDFNIQKPGTDSIGVAIASKNLQHYNGNDLEDTGDILIPISVRGGGYEREWASNVTLGGDSKRPDGEAQGFAEAADKVMEALDYYIARYSLEDELQAGKVKFWISGFSRAGATANLTSKRLVEKYCDGSDGIGQNKVFSYPCEPPKGGTDRSMKFGAKDVRYHCIHNMINFGDVVPLVGPDLMGLKRYGVDHYIPGTKAGEVKYTTVADEYMAYVNRTHLDTTRAYDNKPLDTKPDKDGNETDTYKDYVRRRVEMLKYLDSLDSELIFNDFFQSYGLSFIPVQYGYTGRYNGMYLGDFLIDFMAFLQVKGFNNDRFRYKYAEEVTTIDGVSYTTVEKAARDLMSSDSMSALTGNTSAIKDRISYLAPFSSDVSAFELYRNVIGEWGGLSEKDKAKYINYIWGIIKDSDALKDLPEEDISNLEENIPTLLNLVFYYLDGDWDAYPDSTSYGFPSMRQWTMDEHWYDTTHFLMYSLTLYQHLEQILRNHDPELNMAWARTYDSYFDNYEDRIEYFVEWGGVDGVSPDGYTVDSPKASCEVKEEGSDGQETATMVDLVPDDKTANVFKGNQKVLLEVGKIGDATPGDDNVIGEAIYYDLYDVTDGEEALLEEAQLYRGGIDVKIDETALTSKKYKIVTYARSYGVHSDEAVYYITAKTDMHNVKVFNTPTASGTEYQYKEGEKVSVTAADGDYSVFSHWVITDSFSDDGHNDVTSKLIDSGDEKNRTITFTMPEGGTTESDGYRWDDAYVLQVKPEYYDKVKDITVKDLDAPVSGEALDKQATFSFNNITSDISRDDISLPVTWTYKNANGGTSIQPEDKAAYRKTIYTASVTIPQNVDEKLIFAAQDYLTAMYNEKSVSVTKNSADGSVTISIEFDETDDTEEAEPQPESLDIELEIDAFDLNYGAYIHDYDTTFEDTVYVVSHGDNITLTAPDIPGMVFEGWDLNSSDTGIVSDDDMSEKTIQVTMPEKPEEGDPATPDDPGDDPATPDDPGDDPVTVTKLAVTAKYSAVISEVHATLENAPELGEALPGKDKTGLTVKILEEYEIDPEYVELSWSPDDSTVKNMTAYTATVKLVPKDNVIKVRQAGSTGDYFSYNAENIRYSDDLVVTFGVGSEEPESAAYDTDNKAVKKTFDPIRYILKQVRQPVDIEGLPNGTGFDDVKAVLPKTTKIVLDDGSEMDVEIEWNDPEKTSESSDPLDASIWEAAGSVKIPESTVQNPDEVSLDVSIRISVKAASAALAPTATPGTGTYLADQVVTLKTSTEGGTIWYTLDESDPKDSGNPGRHKYNNGDTIIVTREEYPDGLTIKAYTEKSGMRDSVEAMFFYDFTDKVPVPTGSEFPYNGEEQIGIPGSPFYTLEPVSDGVTIDSQGNAAAKNAGTYKVKASVKDGYKWEIEGDALTEDQEVTFTITKLDLSEVAYIQAKSSYDKKEDLIKDMKVLFKNNSDEVEQSGYTVLYQEKPLGKLLITAVGKGNFEGFITMEVTIKKDQADEDDTSSGKGSTFASLKLTSTKQTEKSVNITWKKVKGAKKYVLYGVNCGKKNKYKKLVTIKASKVSFNVTKIRNKAGKKITLKKATYYKFILKALDSNNKVIATSKSVHVATKGNIRKAANPKKVVVKAKRSRTGAKLKKWKKTKVITLRAGSKPKKLAKSTKLKATYTKAKKSRVSEHVGMRYESSNPKIAKVTSKGKITAKKKGTCKIYVFAQNGIYKVVKIKVK